MTRMIGPSARRTRLAPATWRDVSNGLLDLRVREAPFSGGLTLLSGYTGEQRRLARPAWTAAGCALAMALPPAPALAQPAASDGAPALSQAGRIDRGATLLKRLQAQDQRIATIAFRLARANLASCQVAEPTVGWKLQDLAQYGPRLRPAAKAVFSLADHPGVLAVAPHGPAGLAGVQVGDTVLAINGQDLIEADPPAQPSHRPLEASLAVIAGQLRGDSVSLTLLRHGKRLGVTVRPVPACPLDAEVLPSETLDASADGPRVYVTSSLAEAITSDNDLAIVLGHEFAHDLLRHRELLAKRGIPARVGAAIGLGDPAVLLTEREADYVGLYLTAIAGYDGGGAAALWPRLAQRFGQALDLTTTHPSALDRSAMAERTWREIETKRALGQPLSPPPGLTSRSTPDGRATQAQ